MAAWQTLAFLSGLLAVASFARSAVVVALLLMVPFAVQSWRTSGRQRLDYLNSIWFLVPIIALATFSATWSFDGLNTLTKCVFLLVLVVLLGMIFLQNKHIRLPILVALGLAGLLFGSALETLTDQAFYRFFLEVIPGSEARIQRQLVFDNGKLVSVGVGELNRRTAIACLLIVPTYLAIFAVSPTAVFRILVFMVTAAIGVLVFETAHQSSQMAILAGISVLLIGWYSRIAARRLVSIGWIAAVLLILPIASSGTKLGLHKVSWLPDSAKHRIIIWDYIAHQYTHKPILGIGAGATEALHTTKRAEIEAHQNALGPWTVGITHAHSAYLEIWYELGAVGAVLLLFAGLTLLRRIAALPDPISLIWQVQFAVIATQIAFSYSIWQPWYQASFALSIFMTKLACDSLASSRDQVRLRSTAHKTG
jgi:O-antigen ligase